MTRFEVFHSNLVLFTLIVDIAMRRGLGLLLILKESVMEHLIVNVDLAHLWLHAFSHLLLKCLGFIGL